MQLRSLPVIFILIWMILQFFYARPASIVDDWMGWRQADTQTIARNFLHNGFNIFYPQINWGGSGPGYVESEFQLYTLLTAFIMKFTGDVEWPGQTLSLLFVAISAAIIHKTLLQRFGYSASLIGMIVFLTSQGPVHLSTSIQPDALCFMLYTAGLAFFLRYIENQQRTILLCATLFTAFSGLIKPTALHLCLIQFVIALLKSPQQLRSLRLWLSWFFTIFVVAIYLAHSYCLYLEYGNTFGIIGGDSKFPSIQSLCNPFLYAKLMYMSLAWGIGVFGALAGAYIIFKQKIEFTESALVFGNVIVLLVTFRYTTDRGYGPHYHIFSTLLASWLVAHCVYLIRELLTRKHIIVFLTVCLGFQYGANLFIRNNPLGFHLDPSVSCLGAITAANVDNKDLVVVRSPAQSKSEKIWGYRENNYEDPRVFYIANVRGWVLACDDDGIKKIQQFREAGARYYIEPYRLCKDHVFYQWLYENALTIYSGSCGRIYKFL